MPVSIKMPWFIRFSFFAITAASPLSAALCQPVARNLNVAGGLPQSFVSGLVQDAQGFVWVGTRDGLARYDGRRCKIFNHIPHDSSTLSANTIANLHLDSHQRLWILYETGEMDILHTITEKLLHFTADPVYSACLSQVKGMFTNVQFAAEDAQGNTWLLGSEGGLFSCNLAKHQLQFFTDNMLQLQQNNIVGITAVKGSIVVVTDTALITINSNGNQQVAQPYTFANPHLFQGKHWKDTRPLVRPNGDIVLLDQGRLILYQQASKEFTVYPLPAQQKYVAPAMAADQAGNVFIDWNGVLYQLSHGNQLVIWHAAKAIDFPKIISLLVDSSGVLWAGGNGWGIDLYDLRTTPIPSYKYGKKFQEEVLLKFAGLQPAQLSGNFLSTVNPYWLRQAKAPDGIQWLAWGDVEKFDNKSLCYIAKGQVVFPAWKPATLKDTLPQRINAFAFGKDGHIWATDFQGVISRYNIDSGTITVLPKKIAGASAFNSLLADGDEVLWLASSLHGLYKYDTRNGDIKHFEPTSSALSLPVNQLLVLEQDQEDGDKIWIGSSGGGLIHFSKKDGSCQAYTTRNGLPNNTVYAIVPDKNGVLWCSTNRGIFSFHPVTKSIRVFTSKDGLAGDEFNRFHYMQLANGDIAFGGVDGYTVFDPLAIATDSLQTQTVITDFRINNLPADYGVAGSPLRQSINSLPEIELSYEQNFLYFEFAGLEYNIPEKLQYRYLLEGLNDDWITIGTANDISFSKLLPGSYLLKINASNTAGLWSSHIKELRITIHPPFWKTWWFIGLCIIAGGGLLYFIIYQKIKNVKNKEKEQLQFERKALQLESQALRAQMNPHFVFNCLNSIKLLIQKDKRMEAIDYLTTFAKLIRSRLNNTEQETSLHDELETCKLYVQLESLRFGSKITCGFKIDEHLDTHAVMIPTLIIQPFIENAIWHGILPRDQGGTITVQVLRQGDNIVCSIDDDGIGREVSKGNQIAGMATHESKGMELVKNRLDLYSSIHKTTAWVQVTDKKAADNTAAGTTITITFKIKP